MEQQNLKTTKLITIVLCSLVLLSSVKLLLNGQLVRPIILPIIYIPFIIATINNKDITVLLKSALLYSSAIIYTGIVGGNPFGTQITYTKYDNTIYATVNITGRNLDSLDSVMAATHKLKPVIHEIVHDNKDVDAIYITIKNQKYIDGIRLDRRDINYVLMCSSSDSINTTALAYSWASVFLAPDYYPLPDGIFR